MKILIQFALIVWLVICGNVTFAEELKPPEHELEKLKLASTLTAYGETENDALALATAAKIYFNLSARVLENGQTGQDGKAIDPEELLAKATEIADAYDDKDMIGVIDQIKESGREGSKFVFTPHCVWEYVWVGWFYSYRLICF